mmetsp:Transcript_4185/g.4839  ORF Transcript_4185/g.4839 Transcript_4185/m.4839 type:complete len:174 (-) Transcript_4185:639-1160(-)
MFYGATVWDPILIIAQIVSMQCLYYLSLGILQWLLLGTYVSNFTLYYFFDYEAVNLSSFTGWMVVISYLANAAAGAGYLCLVVERAKKCLDFTATLFFVHLFLSSVHSGFPTNFQWWVLQVIGLVIMAVLGEWLCMRREMQDIPLATLGGLRTSSLRTRGMSLTERVKSGLGV